VRLDADRVQTVVDRAVAGRRDRHRDLGTPPVADAPATRFTLVTDEGTAVREVEALFELPGDSGLTPEQQAARGELLGLLDVLTSPEPLGATGPSRTRPRRWPPSSRRGRRPPTQALVQPEAPGPGRRCPASRCRAGWACPASSPAVPRPAPCWPPRRRHHPDAVGRRRRQPVVAALRPLLPHETGCADLGGS
jgi:hypothetical protein